MNVAPTLALIALLLMPGTGVAAAADAPTGASVNGETAAQSRPAVDNTGTDIRVFEDGSAVWTVRIRTRLDTDEAVTAYERFQERFRQNTSLFLDPFRDRMRSTVAEAGNVTGRMMTVGNFSGSTEIQKLPRRWGVVTYRFRWTNFAQVHGSDLSVGDVFRGGFHLSERDLLTVRGPDGYAVAETAPAPSSNGNTSATWTGPADFKSERPHVQFAPLNGQGGGTPAQPGDEGTDNTTSQPDAGGGLPVVPILAGAALVAAAAIVSRRYITPQARETTRAGESDTSSSPVADEPEVLTDQERVRHLLAEQGRSRQATIAEEFGWSSSKTSRLLSEMADDGEIEKVRIGRENLIRLPDEE